MIFAVYRISVTHRRNDDRKIRVQTLFAVGSLLGLLLHSLVDYPMRSASLGVLAGFVVGLVSRAGGGGAVRSARGVRDWWGWVAWRSNLVWPWCAREVAGCGGIVIFSGGRREMGGFRRRLRGRRRRMERGAGG